jgi:hypothetical protein
MRSHFQDFSEGHRTPATGAGTRRASIIDDLPKPLPQFIDLGDWFIRNPRLKAGEVDIAALEMTLAMTPDERWRWFKCWHDFIKKAVKRGDDIGLLVYGQPCVYERS